MTRRRVMSVLVLVALAAAVGVGLTGCVRPTSHELTYRVVPQGRHVVISVSDGRASVHTVWIVVTNAKGAMVDNLAVVSAGGGVSGGSAKSVSLVNGDYFYTVYEAAGAVNSVLTESTYQSPRYRIAAGEVRLRSNGAG